MSYLRNKCCRSQVTSQVGTNTLRDPDGVVSGTAIHGGGVEGNGDPEGVVAFLAINNGVISVGAEVHRVIASSKVDDVAGLSTYDVVIPRKG